MFCKSAKDNEIVQFSRYQRTNFFPIQQFNVSMKHTIDENSIRQSIYIIS